MINNSDGIPYVTYSNFTALGQVKNVTYRNGVTTDYSYELSTDRLSTILVSNATGTDLIDLFYQYDNVGNITSITDNVPHPDPQTFDEVAYYEYNTNGQKPHAVQSTSDGKTYTYDSNGNMFSDGTRIINYEENNKPESIIISNVTTTFVYDGSGARVKKITPNGTTIYIGKLYECKESVCVKYIFAGGNRIAQKVSGIGNIVYYHQDNLGSSSAISDASGNKIEDIQYLPFGETRLDTGAVSMNHKYTSQELDTETALYFYNARYYNPSLGRFISADTFVPEPMNSQALNRYSYVNNNPLAFTDPSGYWRISASFHGGLGGHTSYDSKTGHFNYGFGYGFGGGVSVGQGKFDIGASAESYVDYGYDNQQGNYVTTNTSFMAVGPGGKIYGVSASGTYYLDSGEYQLGGGIAYKYVGLNIGYSSFGGGNWSTGVSFAGVGTTYNFGSRSWHYSVNPVAASQYYAATIAGKSPQISTVYEQDEYLKAFLEPYRQWKQQQEAQLRINVAVNWGLVGTGALQVLDGAGAIGLAASATFLAASVHPAAGAAVFVLVAPPAVTAAAFEIPHGFHNIITGFKDPH